MLKVNIEGEGKYLNCTPPLFRMKVLFTHNSINLNNYRYVLDLHLSKNKNNFEFYN